MSWQEIGEKDWELIPGKQAKAPDEVDRMLDAVAAGKIIRYTPKDERDATGKRLALGRRAKRRGFTIEVRAHSGQLAVRKTGDVVSQPAQPTELGVEDDTPPAPVAPRRGRPRKAKAGPQEEALPTTPDYVTNPDT